MEDVGQAELLDAGRQGQILDGSHQGGRRPVDAALLRGCCLELRDRVDPRGLRLAGVAVTGQLDLAGLSVPFPLAFRDCEFDAPLHVEGARLRALTLTGPPGCPGCWATGCGSAATWTCLARTLAGAHRTSASLANGGGLAVRGAPRRPPAGRDTVITARGERAVQADRIRTAARAAAAPVRGRGQVRLTGARLGGSLDLVGGRLAAPDGSRWTSAGRHRRPCSIVDGGGRRPVIQGRMDMGSTHIDGQFLFRNATLEGSDSMPASAGTRARGSPARPCPPPG